MRVPPVTIDFGRTLLIICVLSAAGPARAEEVPFSASGTILFTQQESRQDDLYLLHLSDARIERLTDHRSKDSHGAVSPDGERIVFNSERQGWWKIWMMGIDGRDVKQLTQPASGADYYPAWSPDGEHVVFVRSAAGNGDIVKMEADGSNPVNLTRSSARDNFPAWSPDGNEIAFASDRGGKWRICLVDPEGAEVRPIAHEGDAIEPEWYPDGGRIAFQSNAGSSDGTFHIWTHDLETGEARQLTFGPHDDERPAVSPDGQWVAFESDRAGGSQLFLVPADGGEVQQLTFSGYCYGPRWVPIVDDDSR